MVKLCALHKLEFLKLSVSVLPTTHNTDIFLMSNKFYQLETKTFKTGLIQVARPWQEQQEQKQQGRPGSASLLRNPLLLKE
ncbi:hypothetical protein Tco_1163413 [Tanacetum coccineum]